MLESPELNWRRSVLLAAITLLVGIVMVASAVFAPELGLDSNTDWGPARRLLLVAGGLVALVPLLWIGARRLGPTLRARWGPGLWNALGFGRISQSSLLRSSRASLARLGRTFGSWAAPILEKSRAALDSMPGVGWILRTRLRIAVTGSVAIGCLALLVYVWFGTFGFRSTWPMTTTHFDLQATGFLHGDLSLPIQPSPELLAAPDPYALEARALMPPVWDVSFFQGRFYLYWGPVPAVMALLLKVGTGAVIADSWLVLIGVVGAGLAGSALLLSLWHAHFWRTPLWLVWVGVLVLWLCTPMVWLFTRPAVYEAAIACGQMFFLLALLAGHLSLRAESKAWLALAGSGAAGALAVGARINLLPAVLVAALGLTVLHHRQRTFSDKGRSLGVVALWLTLLVGGLTLGGYNAARFGSAFESGHRYQLGRWERHQEYDQVVALGYFIPNVYNYLVNTPTWLDVFPYVKPAWGAYYVWPLRYAAPEIYHTEKVTGLLVSTPFALLALGGGLTVWQELVRRRRKPIFVTAAEAPLPAGSALGWLQLTAALAMAPLLTFVAVSMRHMVDFTPLALILASTASWQLYRRLEKRSSARLWFGILVVLLGLTSVVASLLLSMTGFNSGFENANPGLFRSLTEAFTW